MLRGAKLRAGDSIQRHTLRVFRTVYDDDRIAVDYFDRATGRHMQLQWHDLGMLSVVNEPMKALSDKDSDEELASNERFRKYGPEETEADAELRQWRARTGSRAFQFNVDPENHVCTKCRGVGQLYRGGYVQQNVAGWQAGLNPSDSRQVVGTLHQSGGMETCNWCSGGGQR